MRIIEEKGLGMAVNTVMVGEKPIRRHRTYARIIRLDGGDNVEIINFVTQEKNYPFPEPVSPTIARDKYNELK